MKEANQNSINKHRNSDSPIPLYMWIIPNVISLVAISISLLKLLMR